MNDGNLIYLSYTHPNTYRTTVSDKRPAGVTVDIKKGTWTWRDKTYKLNDQMRHLERGDVGGGIIAVYVGATLKNIDMMLYHSEQALRTEGCTLDS